MIRIDNTIGIREVTGSPDMLIFELMDLIYEMKVRAPEGRLEEYKNKIAECVAFELMTKEEQLKAMRGEWNE